MLNSLSRKLIGSLCVLGIVLCSGNVWAEEEYVPSGQARGLVERFPAGSITSVEVANEVLSAVKDEREAIQIREDAGRRICIEKFLVFSCLDKLVAQSEADRKLVRALEIEAQRFKRKAVVQQRDQALDMQRIRDEEKSAERLTSRQKFEDKEAKSAARQADTPVSSGAGESVIIPKAVPGARELAPEERAYNQEKYDKKLKTLEKRQEAVARKKERTRQRQERNAQEAAKKAALQKAAAEKAAAEKAADQKGLFSSSEPKAVPPASEKPTP